MKRQQYFFGTHAVNRKRETGGQPGTRAPKVKRTYAVRIGKHLPDENRPHVNKWIEKNPLSCKNLLPDT
jgi:hypothetical protein